MARSKTSNAWLREHVNDHYVHLAKAEGWRSRAAFKLIEIDDKDRLLKPGEVVVDLGATPGGWSQVAIKRVGDSGRVFALDLLDFHPIPGVEFLQGDFREQAVLDGTDGTSNRGGGAGGGSNSPTTESGTGGSGVVIIRYVAQTQTDTPVVE